METLSVECISTLTPISVREGVSEVPSMSLISDLQGDATRDGVEAHDPSQSRMCPRGELEGGAQVCQRLPAPPGFQSGSKEIQHASSMHRATCARGRRAACTARSRASLRMGLEEQRPPPQGSWVPGPEGARGDWRQSAGGQGLDPVPKSASPGTRDLSEQHLKLPRLRNSYFLRSCLRSNLA